MGLTLVIKRVRPIVHDTYKTTKINYQFFSAHYQGQWGSVVFTSSARLVVRWRQALTEGSR